MINEENNEPCGYFEDFSKLGFGESDGAVGYFSNRVVCDNYDCKNNNGNFMSAELDMRTGFCKNNGNIEKGIPVDKEGNELEELTKSELSRMENFKGLSH